MARRNPQFRPIVGHVRRQKQVCAHYKRIVLQMPLPRRCRLRGALSGNESPKPHFRRQGIHPRRQLRQRAAPAERRGGGRPVGKPYQQHQPACQPCAHPRQADRTHGRLEQEAAGSCRGKPSAERDQHLRRAVVVSVGDKRSDAQGGCRVNPRRVAQSGSVFPRRHQLQALPQSI